MSKIAIVTGAGSGVGRCTALQLARDGWNVAMVGRRAEALEETIRLSGPDSHRLRAHPADIGDAAAVDRMAAAVAAEWGPADLLVNGAGTNVPQRALEVLSIEDYHAMLNANLNGAFYYVQAVLPSMRSRGAGTIVNVISDAGKQASPKAGPGYVVSKFGLAGLTQAINAEERSRGIRAIAIFPGDIDTPLLDRRPLVPDAEARSRMLRPEDVADCILFCAGLPPHVVVEELIVRPR